MALFPRPSAPHERHGSGALPAMNLSQAAAPAGVADPGRAAGVTNLERQYAFMRLKRSVVRALNNACTAVDAVAYRPAVVRLARPLPSWWSCQLARLSMYLDDRWRARYWSSDDAPAAPQGLCDACHRRAAWLIFLTHHQVRVCGWCDLTEAGEIRNVVELERALTAARARSVAWRWRWS